MGRRQGRPDGFLWGEERRAGRHVGARANPLIQPAGFWPANDSRCPTVLRSRSAIT